MSKPERFDVTGVAQQLLDGNLPDKIELVRALSNAMRDNQTMKKLEIEIGTHLLTEKKGQLDVIGFCMMYGMLMGISMERQKKRII